MVRPKKGLGQHFLTDRGIAEKIVMQLKADNYRNVVEIGPGKGILTGFLLARNDIELYPVEIDNEAVDYLKINFPAINGKLIYGNFLNIDLTFFGEEIGIIGNLPYNISSQIFFKVLSSKDQVMEMLCMVQKEVAERIVSPPGNRTCGILSVLLQTWYDAEYLFTVQPGSFYPKPEVKSGVIRLTRNKRRTLGCNEDFYKLFIKTAFNQRRKILKNSVSGIIGKRRTENKLFLKRPEQLSVEEFIALATELESGDHVTIK